MKRDAVLRENNLNVRLSINSFLIRTIWLLIGAAAALLQAQTVRFTPDSSAAATLWRISPATELFAGASFYYMNPEDSIIVWCDTSESDQTGELYMMVPGYRDSALFLFSNRQRGTRINVSKLIGNPIGVRTEIFFRYRLVITDSVRGGVSWYDTLIRYTGQNRPGIDPVNRTTYPAADFVTADSGARPSRFGHRWAVAGRLRDGGGVPNDTIIFGFEDGSTKLPATPPNVMAADFDFNDVIFRVTGLRLNVELFPDSLALSLSSSSARAGDTVRCNAAVWADSGGTRVRSPQFDSLIHWRLTGAGINGDMLAELPGTDTVALFTGKTSGAVCTVHAWFVNPQSGDTVAMRLPVTVRAGPPAALSIELRADTASALFTRNRSASIDWLQLASNQTSRQVYALLRDRFGNFAGFSQQTVWDTLTIAGRTGMRSGIATVASGDRGRGEGVISKAGGAGDIVVVARDTGVAGSPADSLIVNVVGANYDSLRVAVASGSDTVAVGAVRLSTDQCTTLFVQGRRVDNKKWEAVDVQWDFPFPWSGADVSTPQSRRSFCPADTGSGSLTIVHSAFLRQTLPIQASAGVPVRLVLYQGGRPLPADSVAVAGRRFEASVRLFDRRGVWRSEIALLSGQPIDWKVIETVALADTLDSTGTISGRLYFDMGYVPVKAYRTIRLAGTWGTLSDTCVLAIAAGPARRVVIEPDADWRKSPNSDNPVETLEIPDTRTSGDVYALLRDSLGNFVDSLRAGIWNSADTLVSVSWGTPACRGTVVKNIGVREGSTRITVADSVSGFTDTAQVRLLPYHFTALRIALPGGPVDSLVCSTNDETTLVLQGLRSDTALWREVDGTWSSAPSIVLSALPPALSSKYTFAPQKTAAGWIAAAYGSDSLTDTLPVRFFRGKPLWASMQLLTPVEQRIAGDTLRAVVKLFNRAGPIEGRYCFSTDSSAGGVYYIDSLGDGNRKLKPYAVVNGVASPVVTPAHTGSGSTQCFTNGEDTIGIVLYYAPASDDSLHRIRFLGGGLTAATAPFRLLPGPLASLAVAHAKAGSPADTLYLQARQEWAIVSALGIDAFGNTRGEIVSNWCVSGALHPTDTVGPVSRIRYGSEGVLDDQAGKIHAVSASDSALSGSLQVVIRGPLAAVVSAVTRDLNGNGLLDAVDITFSLSVSVRDTQTVLRQFSASAGSRSWQAVRIAAYRADTTLRFFLDELTTGSPQTAWIPRVGLDNRTGALHGAVDTFSIVCSDGAGPVIWSVTKELVSADDRKQDRVVVALSEKVFGTSGQPLQLSQPPGGMFSVWVKPAGGDFTPVALLQNIAQLTELPAPDTVIFTMSNGSELTNSHYCSIRVDSAADGGAVPFIDAANANRPLFINQKVRVNVTGAPSGRLYVGPNPMRITARREAPGAFHLRHNPDAKNWVLQDGGGTVLQFKIAVPNEKDVKVDGRITLYDLVGNRIAADPVSYVNARGVYDKESGFFENVTSRGILPSNWGADGMVYEYCIYWNGFTLNGSPAAPGVYRAVLTLMITSSKGKEVRRFTETIGVSR